MKNKLGKLKTPRTEACGKDGNRSHLRAMDGMILIQGRYDIIRGMEHLTPGMILLEGGIFHENQSIKITPRKC